MMATTANDINKSGILITVLAFQYVVVFSTGAYDLLDFVISIVSGLFAVSFLKNAWSCESKEVSLLNKLILSLIFGSAVFTSILICIVTFGIGITSSSFWNFVDANDGEGFFHASNWFLGLDLIEGISLLGSMITFGLLWKSPDFLKKLVGTRS